MRRANAAKDLRTARKYMKEMEALGGCEEVSLVPHIREKVRGDHIQRANHPLGSPYM